MRAAAVMVRPIMPSRHHTQRPQMQKQQDHRGQGEQARYAIKGQAGRHTIEKPADQGRGRGHAEFGKRQDAQRGRGGTITHQIQGAAVKMGWSLDTKAPNNPSSTGSMTPCPKGPSRVVNTVSHFPDAGYPPDLPFRQRERLPNLGQHHQEALGELVEDAVARGDAAQDEGRGPANAGLPAPLLMALPVPFFMVLIII